MELRFIANACAEISGGGFTLLCDPWLTDGAYEGAWHHFPPIKTRPEDLLGADALYISHIHPDHFDPAFIAVWPKTKPIVILEQEPNYLRRALDVQGFDHVIAVQSGLSVKLGPLWVTMYGPFCKNVFHRCQVGDVLDSAIYVTDGANSVLNTNDNLPDIDAAKMLARHHPKIDLALLICNAAGPYPACFDNLTDDGKHAESEAIIDRNAKHVIAITKILSPRAVMPFAGDFVLGGKLWRKNIFNGTAPAPDAAARLASTLPIDIKVLAMKEGERLDVETLMLDPVDRENQDLTPVAYAETALSARPLAYEDDPDPPIEVLTTKLMLARANLWERQIKMGVFPRWRVSIDLGEGEWFKFSLGDRWTSTLDCHLDRRLLWRILTRETTWNNAEIGCHIDFVRTPNVYDPDVHHLMNFFHA